MNNIANIGVNMRWAYFDAFKPNLEQSFDQPPDIAITLKACCQVSGSKISRGTYGMGTMSAMLEAWVKKEISGP